MKKTFYCHCCGNIVNTEDSKNALFVFDGQMYDFCWECVLVLESGSKSTEDPVSLAFIREHREKYLAQKQELERMEKQRVAEEEAQRAKRASEEEARRAKEAQEEKRLAEILDLNDIYEYDIVPIVDSKTGAIDLGTIRKVLYIHGQAGWRLVTAFTNELGKNSSSFGLGGYSSGSNSTIDQTVIVFERCVQRKI